ncbi:hypothetical protein DL98DRAFT_519527 [Cadophora sp. DSE1049]|nr:hypothetical protein DL98DRAFT_519527 [Cadophora sp. DSE1049]
MKVSPLRTEFFAQSSIDKDNITVPPRESCGWLLSSSLTAIFSRMHLSSQPRSQQFSEDDAMAKRDVEIRTVACQVSSEDFQDHGSLSSYTSGDTDSCVMEDMFESFQFDPSYNNNHSSYGSSISQLDDEEQIWRLWDANEDKVSPQPLLYPVISDPIQVREQGQLGTSRRLPSQIQSDARESRKGHHLQRSSATRSPRHITRTRVDPSPPVAKTVYSAFPPDIPTIPKLQQNCHLKCHSLPIPTERRVRPQRSRANTTPAPSVPSLHQGSHRSNLNTTAEPNHKVQTSSAWPLSMHSAPTSPGYPPLPGRDLMDIMVETSAFSDDEDDEDESPRFVVAMKSVLNLGRSTSSTEIEKPHVEKARRNVPRRNLSDTLNSWFKKKKRATL